MLNNQGFKFIIAVFGVVLWFFPQAVLGEDTEVKNRLSYISKIVAVIEGSIIKIEGDVRFVKRQTEKTTAEAHLSAKRLDHLEEKIKSVENLLNVIAVEISKTNGSLEKIEKDLMDELNLRRSLHVRSFPSLVLKYKKETYPINIKFGDHKEMLAQIEDMIEFIPFCQSTQSAILGDITLHNTKLNQFIIKDGFKMVFYNCTYNMFISICSGRKYVSF